MYSDRDRHCAAELRRDGATWSEVSRLMGVSRSTLRSWHDRPRKLRPSGCHRCDDSYLDQDAYAALLGYYLGDGCLSRAARYFALRVACDQVYPRIIADVTHCIERVRPGSKVFHVRAPGCIVVQAHWQHWPCLFPQHGPGRKHERPIVLDDWQREIVQDHPGPFLRGLFHSDGSRVKNWATRMVAGRKKRYDYPRWQFVNYSIDIRELCCWALDLVEVPWRQSKTTCISVSRREAVVRLDALIGLKQ